jgi:hypothetical protein
MLLAPSARLNSSGIPLSLEEVSRRIHVYQPESTPLVESVAALVGSGDVRVACGPDFLARFQRECPGSLCVIAGNREQTIDHLLASATIPCHTMALAPLVTHIDHLATLKEALRQAELREVLIHDWMVQRYLPANMFVRDLIHDIDSFGPLLRGTEELPAVDMEWTTNLLRGERCIRPPLPAEGLLTGLPVLLDLTTWMFFAGTSLNVETDATVLSARQWPLPVPEETIRKLLKEPELPAGWQALVHQGLILDPANGTSTVLLKDIHFGFTVQGDYDLWPDSDAPARLEYSVRGLNTTVQSRYHREADGSPKQQVRLTGRDDSQKQRLQRTAELWSRRYRSAGAKLESTVEAITVTFPNGLVELQRAAREAMEQFLRYCRYPHHAELSELDNQYTKAAVTLRAVELANANLPSA